VIVDAYIDLVSKFDDENTIEVDYKKYKYQSFENLIKDISLIEKEDLKNKAKELNQKLKGLNKHISQSKL